MLKEVIGGGADYFVLILVSCLLCKSAALLLAHSLVSRVLRPETAEFHRSFRGNRVKKLQLWGFSSF